ncbi:MAG: 4Fe-4S binding protein [Tissierellia bacterium]|nr:4Fe-4S binding protein [Tissierellia bacterium]MDD4436765.1 4Fe-4S binding protein [Tissierellia bacterium]
MKYFGTLIRILFLAVFLFLVAKGKMMLWLGVFAVSLIAAIIFGRIYCGYICPMNTLMIPTEWMSKKLKIQSVNMPKWLKHDKLPWLTLLLSVVLVIISKKFLHKDLPFMLIWLVIAVIVTLRFKPEMFHNHICPFGALQKTFGKFSRFSKSVDEETCIGCKLCEKSCPSEAIRVMAENKKAVITASLCHQCENCQEVCPKDSIHYITTNKSTEASIIT